MLLGKRILCSRCIETISCCLRSSNGMIPEGRGRISRHRKVGQTLTGYHHVKHDTGTPYVDGIVIVFVGLHDFESRVGLNDCGLIGLKLYIPTFDPQYVLDISPGWRYRANPKSPIEKIRIKQGTKKRGLTLPSSCNRHPEIDFHISDLDAQSSLLPDTEIVKFVLSKSRDGCP